MKKIIFAILVLIGSVIVMGQDRTVLPNTPFYKDTLSASRDTIDVLFSDYGDKETFTFTAYTTTGTDTVLIYTKSLDGTIWVSKASFAITTTPVEYGIDDPEPTAIRVISTSNDASTTVFVLAGKKGLINDYGETSTTTVTIDPPTGGFATNNKLDSAVTILKAPLDTTGNYARSIIKADLDSLNVVNICLVDSAKGDTLTTAGLIHQINIASLGILHWYIYTLYSDSGYYHKATKWGGNVFASLPPVMPALGSFTSEKLDPAQFIYVDYLKSGIHNGSQIIYIQIQGR